MRKCSKCGTDVRDDAEKCPECGIKLEPKQDTLTFEALDEDIAAVSEETGRIYGIEPDYTNSIGIKFKKIEPGEFSMGSTTWPDTKPTHTVSITKPFFIGIYPVTQREWKQTIKNNPSQFQSDDRPVECVSWKDCQIFIKKLNDQEGNQKFRLPTEAEWEYCCRAGTTSDYFFGEDIKKLKEYAWYYENAKKDGTHPVGTKLPNSWELCDMLGNVWEWCHDWYEPYTAKSASDPQGAKKGSVKVHRGGSWCNDELLCSSIFRRFNNPDRRRHNLGFRLAMNA